MEQKKADGIAKITIEITPTEKGTRVKPFKKVLEFRVSEENLPLKVSAESVRGLTKAAKLAEEMCED